MRLSANLDKASPPLKCQITRRMWCPYLQAAGSGSVQRIASQHSLHSRSADSRHLATLFGCGFSSFLVAPNEGNWHRHLHSSGRPASAAFITGFPLKGLTDTTSSDHDKNP